jgi:hypothetical protein
MSQVTYNTRILIITLNKQIFSLFYIYLTSNYKKLSLSLPTDIFPVLSTLLKPSSPDLLLPLQPKKTAKSSFLSLQLHSDPTAGSRVFPRGSVQPGLQVQPGNADRTHECLLCLCGALWTAFCTGLSGGAQCGLEVLFVEVEQETGTVSRGIGIWGFNRGGGEVL